MVTGTGKNSKMWIGGEIEARTRMLETYISGWSPRQFWWRRAYFDHVQTIRILRFRLATFDTDRPAVL